MVPAIDLLSQPRDASTCAFRIMTLARFASSLEFEGSGGTLCPHAHPALVHYSAARCIAKKGTTTPSCCSGASAVPRETEKVHPTPCSIMARRMASHCSSFTLIVQRTHRYLKALPADTVIAPFFRDLCRHLHLPLPRLTNVRFLRFLAHGYVPKYGCHVFIVKWWSAGFLHGHRPQGRRGTTGRATTGGTTS